MINLITVCTDTYPMIYPRKLIKRFGELTNLEFRPYCITDRPDEISDIATPIEPKVKAKGWWNKMHLYGPQIPSGWCLYLDLDIVLCQNFDKEIQWTLEQDSPLAVVSDAIGWMNNKYSSSMVIFKSQSQLPIYERWLTSRKQLERFDGGDQVWTGQFVKDVIYIDEQFPNLKKNLKFHLGKKIFGEWQFPEYISNKIKMVDCGGHPKPHAITNLEYITKNWHEV